MFVHSFDTIFNVIARAYHAVSFLEIEFSLHRIDFISVIMILYYIHFLYFIHQRDSSTQRPEFSTKLENFNLSTF